MLNTISLLLVFGKTVTISLPTTSHIVAHNALCHREPRLSGDHLSTNRQDYSEDGRAQ